MKILSIILLVVCGVFSSAQAQLTCASPADASLGATQAATLLSFPAFSVGAPCQGVQTIHHAIYHRFTAPEDGWYSLHVIPTDSVSWSPRVAVLSACDATEAVIQGWPQSGYPLCDEGGGYGRFTSASFYLQAGQARLLAIGGDTPNDAGSVTLRIARIGSTLMDGAQPLTHGENAFDVAAREPALPYAGACDAYYYDRMGNASRFSFVPSKTGTYRFSFCGSARYQVALSASPDLPIGTLITAIYGCAADNAGRLTTALTAGTTYYLVAGFFNAYDACSTRNATVEFVPETQAPDCTAPADASLGATQAATLLSFPAFSVGAPCQGVQTIHHAIYHRFTAPEDGWYSLHVIPTDSVSWSPRVAVLSACDATEAVIQGWPQSGYPLCDEGGGYGRFTSASFYLQAGQARLLAIGGDTPNDAGSVTLRIARIGSTLMDGAQPLTHGENAFDVAAREPALPYAGACDAYYYDRMGNASRFSFVPSKTGTYRFSFCGSARYQVALSASPDLPIGTLITAIYGCAADNAGRLTTALTAGTTYYLVAGFFNAYDACSTRNATVEFVDPCPADLNGDNFVNGVDLGLLLAAWGTAEQDITGDGTTDGVDFGIMLASWGPCAD